LDHAALSIVANLTEGHGQFTRPDRRNFITIARGSAQECVLPVDIAPREGAEKEPALIALNLWLESIARMISGLISGLDKRDG
jgi:four helix bundle protein